MLEKNLIAKCVIFPDKIESHKVMEEPDSNTKVNIRVFDEIITECDETIAAPNITFVRTLISDVDYIKIVVSQKIICRTNDQFEGYTKEQVVSMLASDKQIISCCASKASLMISQITAMIFANSPLVTPPNFLPKTEQ